MSRIYLRSYLGATEHPGAREFWERNLPGDNLGNLLYTFAVERQLSASANAVHPGPTRARSLDPAWLQEQTDHLVIPLANAFRWTFRHRLESLSELVEGLDIPVTVIGVGAQAGVEGERNQQVTHQVDAAVSRFVRAVLERGPSIGVRGEFTYDYLRSLGFPDSAVDVIGCPSMFLRGDLALRPLPPLTTESRLAVTLSPYVTEMGPVIQHHLERYPHLEYVAQDIATLGLLLGEEYRGKGAGDPLLPTGPEHPLISEGRAWMAVSPPTWLEGLAAYDLCFGTRIHGTIAALLAGTPAFLLAHDSRTLELARYHEIPHRVIGSVAEAASLDIADLAEPADWGPAVTGHAARLARYVAYLDRHGLQHVFAPGESGARFDAAVAATAYPPVVRAGQPVPEPPRARLRTRIAARLRR